MNDLTQIKDKGEISRILQEKGIFSWEEAILFLKKMPYGRNSQRENPVCVLDEGVGTCSTKHGLLKLLAEEQGWENIKLILCIFSMKSENTPKIDNILRMNKLAYIPEAHCYIQYGKEKIDVTHENANFTLIQSEILHEETIEVPQLGEYKIQFHQKYLMQWIENEALDFSFEEIWKIREECIYSLGRK